MRPKRSSEGQRWGGRKREEWGSKLSLGSTFERRVSNKEGWPHTGQDYQSDEKAFEPLWRPWEWSHHYQPVLLLAPIYHWGTRGLDGTGHLAKVTKLAEGVGLRLSLPILRVHTASPTGLRPQAQGQKTSSPLTRPISTALSLSSSRSGN